MNSPDGEEVALELEKLVDSVHSLEDNLNRQYESSDEEDITSDNFKNRIINSKNANISNNLSENDISVTVSDSSNNNSPNAKSSPSKMVDLLLHLQYRVQNELSSNSQDVADGWDNDDDNGYEICTVSEEEYLEYDQVQILSFSSYYKYLTFGFFFAGFSPKVERASIIYSKNFRKQHFQLFQHKQYQQ